jgi:hypothetical protein
VTNFVTKEMYYARNPDCRVCGEPLRAGSGSRFRLTTKQPDNCVSDRAGAVEGHGIEITL